MRGEGSCTAIYSRGGQTAAAEDAQVGGGRDAEGNLARGTESARRDFIELYNLSSQTSASSAPDPRGLSGHPSLSSPLDPCSALACCGQRAHSPPHRKPALTASRPANSSRTEAARVLTVFADVGGRRPASAI